MFSFFNKKPKIRPSFDMVGFDMHNHMLPGIDDGSPDVETSLHLMDTMQELGFKKFVCTPHILSDVHPNNKHTISTAYHQLQQAQKQRSGFTDFDYAAEIMVDYDFESYFEKDKILSFTDKKYVLVEMSFASESPNIRDAIFKLILQGYSPILAHPERYNYYHHNFDVYEELAYTGCDMQINLLSLEGYYGKPVKQIAEKLIDKGLISWVGSDLHHENHLNAMINLANNTKALKYIEKIKHLKNQEHV